MAVTENAYTGNGSTTNYSFTFPYLKSTDIEVQVDATVQATSTWSLANATTVQFNTAPANGAKIKILRKTNVDNLTATFYAGSAIKSEDLNDNFTQNLYSTQETSNRAFETTGGTLTGDLVLGEDVTITFEGATDDAHETVLTVADPTADRTITLPNVTGNVVTTGDTGTVTSAMIADGTIVAGDIATNAVTSAELADNAVDTGAIAADAVTGAKIADDQINSEHYVALSIDTEHIAEYAVSRGKIANDAINGAKIADDAVDSEHYAADSIDAEHYAPGSVDATALASNAVTQAKVADDAIGADELAASAVVTASIVDNAVTLAKMADSSVGTSELVDSAVTAVKLATDAVTNAKVADSAIGTTELATNAVTTAKITDANVTTGKIADGAVTTAKIAASGVTTAKINADAIDSTKIADNAVTTDHIADAELTTLAGMQSGTASILAGGTALTATLAEINTVVDGKGVQTTISDSDAHYPTSGAVVDYVAAQIAPIGGLEVIATDAAFPNTQPSSGVVISIADAGGLVVNGSGTSTTGRTVGGSTVTINNINSQFNSTTVAAGVAFMVTSTGSGQIYNYHKATLKEADILNLSSDIDDFGNRYRVNAGEPSSNNDDGDLCWDTNADKMKVYDGTASAWKEVTSSGDFKFLVPVDAGTTTAATFDGSDTSFDLKEATNSGSAASVTNVNQLMVVLNGVVQKPNAGSWSASNEGFHLTDSDTIRFCTAPATGSTCFIVQSGSALTISTPGDNTVATAKIQNGAVTTAKLGADAVDGTKIADDAINSEHYTDGSIDLAHMSANSVDSDQYVDGSIDTAHIADLQVTTAKIAANAVTDAKITNSTISGSKIAGDAINGTHIGDDVINSEHIAAGAVDLEHMSSESVDEDNLYISNAGTNGQFLQKQSGNNGGLTWATATAQDTLSFRNLIANGAMQVNQRGSTAGLDDFNVVTGTMYTLDRWRAVGSSSFDWDSARVKQVSDSPDEFSNSLRVDIGNTETPGAGQNALIHQYIEAKNLQHLAYGTSSAKSCTLSFWVRSNKTGTYCCQIAQHDPGKYLMYEYSISSANTWEKKTITFSGNTSDAISNDTGIGLEIAFQLACHSDDHVAATTSWTAKPGGGGGGKYLATSNQVNLWDHVDNVWYLTGVQLEIGSTATDFEMRPYGDELARCQRYYYKKPMFYSACMTYTPGSGEHNFTKYGTDHPVEMRAAPSFVGGDFACWSWSSATGIAKANITYSGDHGPLASSLSVACTAANGAAPANGPGSGHMIPCRQLDSEFDAEL